MYQTINYFGKRLNISQDIITLVEKNEIISEDCAVANIFNDYFVDAVTSWNITIDPNYASDTANIQDSVLIAKEKYKYHPSILKIKEIHGDENNFSFKPMSYIDICNEIRRVKYTKSSPQNSVPAKILKENIDMLAPILYNHLNNSTFICFFPYKLKLADITPSHKKDSRTNVCLLKN